MAILVGWHIRTCTLRASMECACQTILCVELFARQQVTFYAGLHSLPVTGDHAAEEATYSNQIP